MYKITVERLTEYDETTTMWRDPKNPDTVEPSKYDFEEDVRAQLVSHQRPTGKKLIDSKKIFEQTVDDMDLKLVLKAVNGIPEYEITGKSK